MNSILSQIAARKAQEVTEAKARAPIEQLIDQAPIANRDFINALRDTTTPAIIAEIKKASPSKGLIRENFNVTDIAKAYAQHGARCLSVLTDVDFFQGHPDYLLQAKSSCTLPVLRKDFIIDDYQIHESKALGADCILLIVALLDDKQLFDFTQIAQNIGLAVLVESHTREELERALILPTPLVGINNRSLHTFKTDIQLSIELKDMVPQDRILITESGINHRDDILLMQQNGINTFLIGESLMRQENIGQALEKLMG